MSLSSSNPRLAYIFLFAISCLSVMLTLSSSLRLSSSLGTTTLLAFKSVQAASTSRLFASAASSSLPSLSTTILNADQAARTARCIDFLNQSPDPFHVVQSVEQRLQQAGFQELQEEHTWSQFETGGKYYFKRYGSSIVAFSIGSKFKPGNGFKILGAHTDSPNLKLKPKSKRGIKSGVMQLNVECYGGGLWHTWLDRDLSLSGRVILRQPHGQFIHKLIKIPHSVLRIPNLCIHLKSAEERESFKLNKEDHLQPILCQQVDNILSGNGTNSSDSWKQSQEPLLLHLLANELQCEVADIVDFELSLFDTQPASRSGLFSEFLCSSRIDNLASCFAIMESFVDHAQENLQNDEDVSVMALFDHEEVGSESTVGAGSTLISSTIERLHNIFGDNSNNMGSAEAQHASKAR